MQTAHFKLGRKPRRTGVKRLQFARFYTPSSLPAAPAKTYYEYLVKKWGMLANDQLGDCTAAGVAHSLQNAVAHSVGAGTVCFNPNDAQTIDFYSKTTGYVVGNPATDNGGDEDRVLDYAVANGFAGHALLSRVEIDPQNIEHVKQAIWLFGSVYTGIDLPLSAQNQETWDVTSGGGFFSRLFSRKSADPTPGSWGGHCTVCPGYGSEGMNNVTWGSTLPMTWAFWQKYASSCYALLWKDWISFKALAEYGFDAPALVAAQKALAV